ncbi:MAG: PAS domain S-box protein [Gammaproteobacteria bacterium]|nr:PAS domain S-box protein [Gammaproteobacteria bacterium]
MDISGRNTATDTRLNDELNRLVNILAKRDPPLAEKLLTLLDEHETLQLSLKELEHLRRHSEAIQHEWVTAVDALQDPIFILDDNLRILRANLAYAQHAGMDIRDVIGRYYWEIFPRRDEPLTCCQIAPTSNANIEETFRLPDGEEFICRSFPIQDADSAAKHTLYVLRNVTTERKAKRKLDKSEQRYRTLTENLSEIIYRADPHTLVTTYINRAVEKIFGYTVEEWLREPTLWEQCLYPEDRDRVFQAVAEAQQKQQACTLEYRILRRDHAIRWVVDRFDWECGDRGEIVSQAGVLSDITEQKLAEQALRDSEERYRSTLDCMLEGCQIIGRDWRYLYLNDTAVKQSRKTREELIGNTMMACYPGIEETAMFTLLWRCMETQVSGAMENEFYYPDGSRAWFELSIEPVPEGIFVLSVDITKRKQTEAELRNSRDLLQSIIEHVPIRLFWKDKNLNYLGSNTAFARDTGMPTPDDIIGKDDYQLAWREFADRYRADDKQVIDNDMPKLGIEEPMHTADGRKIILRTSKVPLHDGNGRVQGVLGIFEDITELKRNEIQLRRANRALRTISACNMALVHTYSEPKLLQEICRIIVEVGEYAYVWIGYAEHSGTKRVKPVAQAGLAPEILKNLPLSWEDDEYGASTSSKALREGKVVVASDVKTAPVFKPWHALYQQLDVNSIASFPLLRGTSAFGALTIYSRELDSFDEDELKLLSELATDLRFGILTARDRREHERLQKQHLESIERLDEALADTIRAISLTLEKRDPYTAGHQQRVSDLSVAIGAELGLDTEHLLGLRLGAMIHDIGKIYVPAEILNRPGRLTQPEFEIIKTHPQVGYDIVKDIKFTWPVAQMILQHHERLDGSGYPQGLKGDTILFEAKIIAVADAVEAISAHRPYRPALGVDKALEEILKYRGIFYDPEIVDICLRLFSERRFSFSS